MRNKTALSVFIAVMAIASLGFSTSAYASEGGAQVEAQAQVKMGHPALGARIMNFLGIHREQKNDNENGDDNSGDRKSEKNDQRDGEGRMMDGIRGTVTAVSGNTITVDSKTASTTTTTFAVDATNSKFIKNNASTTIASILVGDTVAVVGPVNGTSVTAKLVVDGAAPIRELKNDIKRAVAKRIFEVRGVVTAVNGFSLTVDGKSGTSTATSTFAVDATNAKVVKDNATTTVSSILVGDRVLVNGDLTGTSITATLIIDGKLPPPRDWKDAVIEDGNKGLHLGAFIGKFGGFFKNLFHLNK